MLLVWFIDFRRKCRNDVNPFRYSKWRSSQHAKNMEGVSFLYLRDLFYYHLYLFTEMKYEKRLKQQIQETLPEWQNKFICYKDLKKLVRLVEESMKVEADFIFTLDAEIHKFNWFFVEQEEDFIIRHEELQERIKKVMAVLGPIGTHPSRMDFTTKIEKIRDDIVNFHGEMVLLLNYSNINFTGLAKILKKYDKRTSRCLRLPFIQKVFEEPFFKTHYVTKLVKECENTIEAIFVLMEEDEEGTRKEKDSRSIVVTESILKNTLAALMTMEEMKTSSTCNQFSVSSECSRI